MQFEERREEVLETVLKAMRGANAVFPVGELHRRIRPSRESGWHSPPRPPPPEEGCTFKFTAQEHISACQLSAKPS